MYAKLITVYDGGNALVRVAERKRQHMERERKKKVKSKRFHAAHIIITHINGISSTGWLE